MTDTRVSQTREQISVGGTQVYRIISVVTDKGELPHASLFVLEIADKADPTDDTFLRVASPYDLTNLYTDRNVAIMNDATIFLSPDTYSDFEDLEVAIQAQQEISGRINTLVTLWQTYMDDFYTPTAATLIFPSTDEAYSQQLKDAYASAKEARIAAEEELESKTEELTAAEEDYSDAADAVSSLKTLVELCDALRNATTPGYWEALKPQLNTYETGNNTFADNMKAAYQTWSGSSWDPSSAPDISDSWYNMYHAILTWVNDVKGVWETDGQPQQSNTDTTLTTLCNEIAALYTTKLNTQSAASSTLSDAQEAKEKATVNLTAAQEAEDEALANVVSVCPDFDPSSV